MQDVHESYQVDTNLSKNNYLMLIFQIVRRVMNSKSKFRNFGKGAVKGEKIATFLTAMQKESEKEKLKKQEELKASVPSDRYFTNHKTGGFFPV